VNHDPCCFSVNYAGTYPNYCYDEKNFGVPIMEAIERVLGK